MKARVIAWCLLLLVGFGVFKAVQAFSNPWGNVPSITSVMPVVQPCKEDCK